MTRGLILVIAGLCFMAARPQDPPKGIQLPSAPTYVLDIKVDADGLLLRDINGDGYLDLFCACNGGGRDADSVMFLSNKGRFDKPSWTSLDAGVSSGVALADLDGDGDDDLVLTRYNHDPAVAYRNTGKGVFERSPFWTSADTEWARRALAGDFDGDGFQDILADDRIYRGSKEGLSPTFGWKMEDDPAISEMIWVDVDGDSVKDLVISSWLGGAAYSVYRGLKENFEKKPSIEASRRGEFTALAVGDIDGDRFPEIVVGATTGRGGDGRVRYYANVKGRPAAEPCWMSDDMDCNADDVSLSDFDGDGDLDLFVLSGERTAIFENRAGKLETQPCWRMKAKGGQLRVADLDKDGRLDLLIESRGRLQFYMGAPVAAAAKVETFPPLPKLPALTRRDLLPDVEPELESLLAAYRKSREEDVLAKLRLRSAAVLGAIETLEASDLGALVEDLKPRAEQAIKGYIAKLSSEQIAEREEASARLLECGASVLPALETAAASDDPERSGRAKLIIEKLRFQAQGPQVVDVLGMKLARLTSRLKKRYGYADEEGVVVLEVAEPVGPDLDLSNLREGDLFLGIGGLGDYGRKVTAVKTPLDMAGRILLQDDYDEDPQQKDRNWRLAGYQYVCGPLHPAVRGSKRLGRMTFNMAQWKAIKDAVRTPKTWTPEK